jgi:hypothetical protein
MSLQKNKKILIQEKLERRILHGLSCEWEVAVSVLISSDREKLRKPLFGLGDMNWDAVRETLLHEIAHQFTGQVLGAHNEPPHGPKFKRACHLLRANPRASGNYRPLDERVLQDSPSPQDKIMFWVKKLMALAQSKNRHEAEAAMSKAHELIAKHNIDIIVRDEDRNFVSVFLGIPALRHFREDYYLSNLLHDFYFVYAIWIPAYVLEKGKMGNVLEISGTIQNIRIANYVYDFVKHFIDSQWIRYNKERGLSRYRKTDFAMGIMEGFRSKLDLQTQAKRKTKHKPGLIKIEDPLLQKHVRYKYQSIRTVRGKALREDKDVLNDGISVGKDMVISKGIMQKGRKRGLMLR